MWLTDFICSRSQRVALSGILSSPLPVMAGLPRPEKHSMYFLNNILEEVQSFKLLALTIGHFSFLWQATYLSWCPK